MYLTETLENQLKNVFKNLLNWKIIISIINIVLLIFNLQINRVLAGYSEAINRNNTQIFEYIYQHKKSKDIVISPTPSFAAISLGGLDYFLMGTEYLDGIYWHNGKLIDRWAGGVVINNIDKINQILEKSQRVWIHVDDAKQGKFDRITWEYIQILGKPVMDSFGTRLRVWQPEDGLPKRVPNHGKDLGAY